MVEWRPSVRMGSLIKNKLGKCFSTAVNLESCCFFGSGMLSGLCPLTADSGQGAPARRLFLSQEKGNQEEQPGRPGPQSPHQNWVPPLFGHSEESGVTEKHSGHLWV